MTKLSLLLLSMFTIMSGTVIVASLPLMSQHFSNIENIDLLSKLLLTVPSLFIAIISPVSGHIIDKFGRVVSIYFGLLLFSVGGTMGFFIENFWLILMGRAIMGIGVAFLMTGVTTLIGDYFNYEERHKFIGTQGAFNGIGGVFFISGGGFLASVGWEYPFLIYLLPLLFLPIFIKGLYEPKKVSHHTDDIDERIFKKSFLMIYITAFITMNLFYIIPTQIPFLLSHEYNQSPSSVGILIAFAMLISAFISSQYKRLRTKFTILVIYSILFIVFGIGLFIMSQATTIFGFYIGAVFNGIGMGLMLVNLNAWMLEIAPNNLRGRIAGMMVSFIFLGQFTSPLILQYFVSSFSLINVLFIISFISLFIGFYLAWHNQKFKYSV